VTVLNDESLKAADLYNQAVADGYSPLGTITQKNLRSASSIVGELGGWTHQSTKRRLLIAHSLGLLNKPPKVTKPVQEKHTPDRHREQALQQENQRLKRLLTQVDASVLTTRRIAEVLGNASSTTIPPPDWLFTSDSKDEGPGIPVIQWCDWHIGETVFSDQVKGYNEFNEEVADARIKRVLERTLHIAFNHVKTPQYQGAVLSLGGDFVSGWLHDELVATDWCPPTVAISWCVSRMRRCIDELIKAFKRLVIVCVPGNHGRITRKPWAKHAATASYDHVIYAMLAEIFRDDKRITFVIPHDGEVVVQVSGTRILFMHGHELGVKGGDGIIGCLGPIMRGAMKIGSQQRSMGYDFDVICMGHFHQEVWLPRRGIIVGPTLKGYDEYARRERFRAERAGQLLFFVHPKWGPNNEFVIYAQDPLVNNTVPFVALQGAA